MVGGRSISAAGASCALLLAVLAPATSLEAAPAVSLVDPIGDTTDPRADLTGADATISDGRLTLSAAVAQYTNPTGDGSWVLGVTGPTWELDLDGDGVPDASIVLSNIQGTLFGSFYGSDPAAFCPVERAADPTTSSYIASIPITCLGDPTGSIGVTARMRYRTFDMVIHEDRAPDAGWSSLPTSTPAPGPDAVTPARIADTRPLPAGSTIDGRFVDLGRRPPGSVTSIAIAGRAGVPLDADAAYVTLTAFGATEPGFITLFPCGADAPLASTVNFLPGQVASNTALASIASDGSICIMTSTAIDLAVDVDAWVPGGGAPTPVTPARVLDSRAVDGTIGTTVDGAGSGIGRRPAGSVTTVQLSGRGGVPTDAIGAQLNVTAVMPDAPGYLTVFGCGAGPPLASHANYRPGGAFAVSVFTQLGGSGQVCIFSSAATDLVVDVTGSVAPGAQLVPITPTRFADSRVGQPTFDGLGAGTGPVSPGIGTEIRVGGRGPVPADAQTVLLSVTAVSPDGDGYLTVHPCLDDPPTVSHVSYAAGSVQPGFVVVPLSATGSLCVDSLRSSHAVIDVVGFVPAAA